MKKLECQRRQRIRLPQGVLGVTLHPDGQRVFAACLDGVYAMDLSEPEPTPQKLYQHGSYASNIVHLQEPNQLVSAGYDGALRWYDLHTDRAIRTVQAHSFWCWDLALSHDQQTLASSTGQYLVGDYEYRPQHGVEPGVRVWDAANGELQQSFDFLPPTQCVAVSADGSHVAAANLMGDVAVWRTSGERVAAWNTPDFTAFGIIKSHCQIGGIYAIEFLPDSQELLVAGMGPMRDPMAGNGKQRWQRFDWSTGDARKVSQSNDDQVGEGLMETLAVHPDGSMFVMAGRLRGGSWSTALFDLESGDLITSIKTNSRVTKAVFSSDGLTMLLAGSLNQKKEADAAFGVVDCYDLRSTT